MLVPVFIKTLVCPSTTGPIHGRQVVAMGVRLPHAKALDHLHSPIATKRMAMLRSSVTLPYHSHSRLAFFERPPRLVKFAVTRLRV